MSLAALRDAINLLTTRPALWLPGFACGVLASLLWLVAYYAGAMVAGRLVILVLLLIIYLCAMTYSAIRKADLTVSGITREGASSYFRILIPVLVIAFSIFIVFILIMVTLAIIGMQADYSLLSFLTFGIMLPSIMLTYFADCAAVFEGRKVFESIRRSIEIVTFSLFDVLLFYLTSFLIFCAISFAFFVAWTAALADQLEPLTHFNETQYATFTPGQLAGYVGTEGVWVSAVCLFAAVSILFPLLVTYKACFFRQIGGTAIPIQQVTGEYDSKGRWYKY